MNGALDWARLRLKETQGRPKFPGSPSGGGRRKAAALGALSQG